MSTPGFTAELVFTQSSNLYRLRQPQPTPLSSDAVRAQQDGACFDWCSNQCSKEYQRCVDDCGCNFPWEQECLFCAPFCASAWNFCVVNTCFELCG
jgi:hypothetical protein